MALANYIAGANLSGPGITRADWIGASNFTSFIGVAGALCGVRGQMSPYSELHHSCLLTSRAWHKPAGLPIPALVRIGL